jgi:chromosomal replication initiation ATPase DnaA
MKKEIFDRYTNAIAKQFHLSIDDMFKKSKKRDIVDARQMLYFACQERPIRLAYIKKFLAEYGYDVQHSTILHGIKQAKKLIDSDPDYKEILDKIQSE